MLRYYMLGINGGLIVKPCLPASAKLHKKQQQQISSNFSWCLCVCECVPFPSHFSLFISAHRFWFSMPLISCYKHTQTEENERKKHIEHWERKTTQYKILIHLTCASVLLVGNFSIWIKMKRTQHNEIKSSNVFSFARALSHSISVSFSVGCALLFLHFVSSSAFLTDVDITTLLRP